MGVVLVSCFCLAATTVQRTDLVLRWNETRGRWMMVSDTGRVVLQTREAEIVCDFARSSSPSSSAHAGSMANQTRGSPMYANVALHVHVKGRCDQVCHTASLTEIHVALLARNQKNQNTKLARFSSRRMRRLLRRDHVRLSLLPAILRVSVAHQGCGSLHLDLRQDDAWPPISCHRGLLERTSLDILINS
jgi:hypothetical protein